MKECKSSNLPGMARRDFLRAVSLGAAATAIPSFSCTTPAIRENRVIKGRKINVAAIGCGSKGAGDIAACENENVVALCDVDFRFAAEDNDWGPDPLKKFPKARRYADYRQMLREMGDRIDAVTISTPDHMHFAPAMMAVSMGKHVFVQKPLTHTVEEARLLTAAARKYGVVTVMGNQGHCTDGMRHAVEWVRQEFLGNISEVHIWSGCPEWPQGYQQMPKPQTPPTHLDWNLWLGVAPNRPFSHIYHPNRWRAWWDFGNGGLGDMGCHMIDAAYWALDLGAPESVSAQATGGSDLSGPNSSIVTYRFPARGTMPPVTLKWYDGGNKPPRPLGLSEERFSKRPWGQYMVGSKAVMYDSSEYGTGFRIIPESRMREVMKRRPKRTIPRVPGGRPQTEWLAAIKGEGPTPGSNFDYAGPLTEVVLLGNIAVRVPGKELRWDSEKMRFTNSERANALVGKPYRRF